jgi:hypothetical protein
MCRHGLAEILPVKVPKRIMTNLASQHKFRRIDSVGPIALFIKPACAATVHVAVDTLQRLQGELKWLTGK